MSKSTNVFSLCLSPFQWNLFDGDGARVRDASFWEIRYSHNYNVGELQYVDAPYEQI